MSSLYFTSDVCTEESSSTVAPTSHPFQFPSAYSCTEPNNDNLGFFFTTSTVDFIRMSFYFFIKADKS